MNLQILKLKDGAKNAKGITVIIDVFRAFSVESYLLNNGCKYIIPVATVEEAFKLKSQYSNSILIGERNGIKVEGFDFGNSPSEIVNIDFNNKIAIHTTSAGTQGIALATNASEIIGGSLLNAKAIAKYIKSNNPDYVSLVAMGLNGLEETEEDNLCAEYIKELILGNEPNIDSKMNNLRYTSGRKFFEETDIFPTQDFYLCLKPNIFNFIVKLTNVNGLNVMEKINIK